MQHRIRRALLAWLLVAAIATSLGIQAASAQVSFGGIVGFVFQCTNGHSVPVANAAVSVSGGPSSGNAQTTTTGDFTISGLAPGVYTVTASSAGKTAVRPSVTVGSNMVDAGDMVLGTVFGCGDDQVGDTSPIPAAAPTFTPVVQPTNTPAPVPTDTPVPAAAPLAPAPSDLSPTPETGPGTGPEPSNVDVPVNTDVSPPPADTSPDAGVTGLPGPDTP